ncbi:MAG: hypothetical protein JOZ62_23520 [Acidobacteriaceae bacterium]|nr:hypothetical protein [Acidobacteriaceae bacterium]
MRRLCALWLLCVCAFAQTTQNPTQGPTISPQVQKPQENLGPLQSFKDAITKLFTAKPVHLTAKSIVPGGGFGLGPVYTWNHPAGEWNRTFTADGVASTRAFWLAEAKLRLTHPAFSSSTSAGDSFVVDLYGRTLEMPLLPFYGLGPNTTQAGLSDYAERETVAGVTILNPITSGFGIGGTVEEMWPQLSRPDRHGVIAANDLYSETSAPGLSTQPSFTHLGFFLHPYHRYPFEFDSQIGYHYFHDNKGSGYSFHRFRADARYNFYPVFHGGQPHRDNVLSIRGLLETSYARGPNRVPFYLDDTLGGSDMQSQPTLRGFRDFRFRGPDLILFQTEYDKRLYSALGMMAFYDTGKVALRAGDLGFGNFRHSFGAGGTVWLEGRVVFRAYVGLGGGEGVHPYFGIMNVF